MPPSRREELIDAAMRVFYREGFHSIGLDKVLQEAGISRMTLYNHFKSKDELIVAALRRRDEVFRNQLMKFVESRSKDPVDRILAVFDFHEQWMTGKEFHGCMFVNASAEFSDTDCAIRRVAAEHKGTVLRYLSEQCELAGLKDAKVLASQLSMLLEGAIVTAQVVGQVAYDGSSPGDAARCAKQAAERLIKAARG